MTQIYPQPINDNRLKPDMRRARSGETQLFYNADNRGIQSYNADVSIKPPEKHIYAELIDGQWMWVNGCSECNGKPRDWMTYIECEEHNRCQHCRIPRAELSEPPWGRKTGWVCKPCAEIEHEQQKSEALAGMPVEFDEYNYKYCHEIRCPWCNSMHDSSEMHSAIDNPEVIECHTCDKEFRLSGDVSIEWSMERIE